MENTNTNTNTIKKKKLITLSILFVLVLFFIINFIISAVFTSHERKQFQTHILGSYSFYEKAFKKDYSKINLSDSSIFNEYFSPPNISDCFFNVTVQPSIYNNDPARELHHEYSFECKNNKSLNFSKFFLSENHSGYFNGYIYFSHSAFLDTTFVKNETLDSYSKKDLEKIFNSESFQIIREEISETFKLLDNKRKSETENRGSWQ